RRNPHGAGLMAKRLTRLTVEQEAALGPWADAWIAKALAPGPVDREQVEDGMRRCYEYAGIPWHGNVVWVDSPLVVGFAGPIAASLVKEEAVDGAVGGAIDGAVGGAVYGAVGEAVRGAVYGAVYGAVGEPVDGAVDVAVREAVGEAVDGAIC